MDFLENIYNWALMQSFWLQVLLVMLAILIGLAVLALALTICILILYVPSFILGRYLGLLSIFLIVPTFIVIVTDNGRSSPIATGWMPFIIILIATFKGYIDGLKERKIAKIQKSGRSAD